MSEPPVRADSAGDPAGIITRASPHPTVAETVERLRTAIGGRGMTVFATIDHGANARQAGLALRDTVLVIFGSPNGGHATHGHVAPDRSGPAAPGAGLAG